MTVGTSLTLSVQDVHRRFGAVTALGGVRLELHHGEILGIVGPDGAGKTTLIRALAGLLDPDEGQITVLGRAVDDPEVRELVGLMPQHHSLYGDLSIAENLNFFRQLFCLSKKEAAPRIERLLAITRLGAFTERRAEDLSGGMYEKLALSCALLHQPQVLLLDEPTNGVDPVSRRELWELLGEFVGQGMAVLVSTPYMDEAERCHRVCVLHEGHIIAEGVPSQLVRDLDHPVFVLRGGDRRQVQAIVDKAPEVVAASPAGAQLRVVVTPEGTETLRARVAPLGVELVATRADFEDLFLARIAEGAR